MTKNNNFEKSHNVENCKRGHPLGFLKIQFAAKYQKKLKRDPLETLKSCRKKTNKDHFEQSHSDEKCRRGALGFFNIHSGAKYLKNMKGGPFGDKKNFKKKSHSAEKN